MFAKKKPDRKKIHAFSVLNMWYIANLVKKTSLVDRQYKNSKLVLSLWLKDLLCQFPSSGSPIILSANSLVFVFLNVFVHFF